MIFKSIIVTQDFSICGKSNILLDVESPPVGNDPLGLHYIKTLHESILKLFRLFQTKDPKVFKYERFHFNVGNRYNLRWLNFRGSVSTGWYFNGIPVIHVNVCKGFTQLLQHLHSHIQCIDYFVCVISHLRIDIL